MRRRVSGFLYLRVVTDRADEILAALAADRYSERAFPPYRFVQGRTPHPTTDPAGHSYLPPGRLEPVAEPIGEDQWRESPDYLFGCDLYNHGYWWEAHESFEAVWHTTSRQSIQGRFLQGLIQFSACHLKLHARRPRGVEHYLLRGTRHLADARRRHPDRLYMGLDLVEFVERVHGYFACVTAVPVEQWRHDPARFPYIRLSRWPENRNGCMADVH